MLFPRAVVCTRQLAVAGPRRFASTSPPAGPAKPSNLPYLLLGSGVAGIATYIYLEKNGVGSKKVEEKKQEKSPLDPQNFVDFKLKKIEPYNHNTAKFTFELPENEASLLPVASCVVVKSSDPEALKDAKGRPVIRPYTPISPSDKKGELTFLIKKYDSGKMTVHIHDLKPGDSLSIKGPIPKWPWKMNEFEDVGMIAGGSGITPMYQILNHALTDPSNKTKFKLIFANLTEPDILLREEFDALKKKYPNNFDVIYTLDKPSSDWTGSTGYVSSDLIKKTFSPASAGEKVKIFVCGPPGQLIALAGKKDGMKQGEVGGTLKELGYTEDQVYKF
ncbi:hypothetical protein JAAARDRAFT_41396 [Jaapia argillacea MUCL 33604]|uniref:cytochrome-b5 reductase n=1 Tax=Jaapia argillacea MUCL 33604 TaxID=933084 RepID=A0A067P8N3_9AGAM|nr:hypothetical protein JAAARDRAFT_41396 [Jaapia argillacea MUCL 33604]